MKAIGNCHANPWNQAKKIRGIPRIDFHQCQSFSPCLFQWDLSPREVWRIEQSSESKLDGRRRFLPRAQKFSVPRPNQRNKLQGEMKTELNEISWRVSSGISYLKVGGTSRTKSPLNIPSTIWRKVVVSLTTSFTI